MSRCPIGFVVEDDELARIDDYARIHYYGNRSAALRDLVLRGITARPKTADAES